MKTIRKSTAKDMSASYNKFKNYNGQWYTGARVGRGQRWYYDKGEWKEHKITPDKWEFIYEVRKRRAGRAPEGSGAPIGTEYHWYILAHQNVRKLDANSYSTSMTGVKYKIAHKRANKDTWNASEKKQYENVLACIEEMVKELKKKIRDESRKIVTAPVKKPEKGVSKRRLRPVA